MTVFYLVRHARADWTRDENRPLSGRGREDALRVADSLAPYPVCAIYTSPYRRAMETIAPLAEHLELPMQLEPGLVERRLGRFSEGDFFRAVETTWRDPAFAHPGGETNAAAQQRGLEVVRRLRERHAEEHVVLSTHGNLMALVLQAFDPTIDYAFWHSLTMPDIYNLDFSQAGKPVIERLWRY